jgi:hypothetical protein
MTLLREKRMTTTYSTLRMNGSEFVLVPKAEFRRMTEEDRRDARKVAQSVARFRAGKSKALPLAQVKKELGLS